MGHSELGKEFCEDREITIGWVKPADQDRVVWKTKRFGPNVQGFCTLFVMESEADLMGHHLPFGVGQ